MWCLQDGSFGKAQRIVDREDDYRKRRLNRIISPARNDAYAMGDKTPAADVMTYADIMKAQQLQRDTDNTLKNIADKQKEMAAQAEAVASAKPTKASGIAPPVMPVATAPRAEKPRKRNRWDQGDDDGAA